MAAAAAVKLDGSSGEGGGQILRTALTLSLLTGRPFQLSKIRANRDRPGLRPQHLAAVLAAADLSGAEVRGASVGSRELHFRPREYAPRDLVIDIGTAGATALVLQTLHLPIALRSDRTVAVTLDGGTFNTRAPSFPFLTTTWREYLDRIGLSVDLSMPQAGFYPVGGGRLEARIAPGRPLPLTLDGRGSFAMVRGIAGAARLPRGAVAERMKSEAERLVAEAHPGIPVEIETVDWPARSPGAAIALTAVFAASGFTAVGLGERGKPAEAVAAEAVAELLAYVDAPGAGVVDPHSADQLLLPLALADGASRYTTTEITEHTRTNAKTIAAFLDCDIALTEPSDGAPGIVAIAQRTEIGRFTR